ERSGRGQASTRFHNSLFSRGLRAHGRWHAPFLGTARDSSCDERGAGVDIPREPAKRGRKRLMYGGLCLLAVVGATVVRRDHKPAAPKVDRAAVWVDSVVRGPLVIEVRGPGTLVPERIRYISAIT